MSQLIRACSFFLLAAFLVLPASASAQDQPRQHDGGIFIRLSAGVGSTSSEVKYDNGNELELNEGGGNHNFAIGGIVGGKVALHGTLFGWATSDPQIDLNGNEFATYKGTVSLNAVGGGATWYFGPNFYLSGSLGFAWLSFKDQNVILDTGVGGAIDLTIGKEWWVSDRWGLGVALGFQGYGVPADDAEEFTGGAASVRFTATFN
jgi:hypothetical protein